MVVWIALLLAVCNAVAPPLLRMAAVARGEAVVEVCTAFGIKRVGAGANSGGSAPASADASACKFCLGSQSPCAPTIAGKRIDAPALHLPLIALPGESLPGDPSWLFSRPRGPPHTA
ncbi:MAG: hypothetical protein IT532_12165 [Burkholderiales bacterium]|nr:hypothetical protein [Burkholderiales bacterium]